MQPDLDRLESIARAATPGPWWWNDMDEMVSDSDGPEWDMDLDWTSGKPVRVGPTRVIETDSGYYPPRDNDRAHIAAFDPPTVLALIALARRP